MKIMTQNADVLLRGANGQKIRHLAEKIIRENITLIAMQNVAQSLDAAPISSEMWEGAPLEEGMPDIRLDNAAAILAQALKQCGKVCSWIWFSDNKTDGPQKKGSAFLSVGRRIRCVDRFAVGMTFQPVLGVQLEGMDDWFYQLPMHNGSKDRFLSQWKLVNCCIAGKRLCSPVWLIGDLDRSVERTQTYYDSLIAGGWLEVNAGKEAFSNIWCSRKRETYSCASDDLMHRRHGTTVVIDVKEDTL